MVKRAAWWLSVSLLLIGVFGLWHSRLQQATRPLILNRPHDNVEQVYAQLRAFKMYHGNPMRRWIALTFDDGPHPYHTPILLRTLRQLHVRATFFVVGENVDRYPYLVRQMVKEGHEVENHTYHHLRLSQVPLGVVWQEIEAGAEAVWRATGYYPYFVRPPGGAIDAASHHVVQSSGMVLVMWTQDPADYERPDALTLKRRLFWSARPGSIILLHEKVPVTVEVLPDFVREMRRQGYEFVTIAQMWEDMAHLAPQWASYRGDGLPLPRFGGSWE